MFCSSALISFNKDSFEGQLCQPLIIGSKQNQSSLLSPLRKRWSSKLIKHIGNTRLFYIHVLANIAAQHYTFSICHCWILGIGYNSFKGKRLFAYSCMTNSYVFHIVFCSSALISFNKDSFEGQLRQIVKVCYILSISVRKQ